MCRSNWGKWEKSATCFLLSSKATTCREERERESQQTKQPNLRSKAGTQSGKMVEVLTDCLVACAFCLGSSYCLILEPAAGPPGAMAGFRPPALGPGSYGSKGKQCVSVCVCRDWHHFETHASVVRRRKKKRESKGGLTREGSGMRRGAGGCSS